MAFTTNRLVAGSRRLALPSLAAAAVVCSVLALHQPGVHAAAISAAPLDDNSVASLTALDSAMEALAARVTPAVVNIAVTATPEEEAGSDGGSAEQLPGGLPPGFSQFFGNGGGGSRQARPQQQQPMQHGVGSGVIISPDGYIVTNNHVVRGATTIKVTLNDRRILTGKVIGVDKLTDIAVIKVNAHDLPFVSWGDSTNLHPGQTVLAFGSPFGSLQFSVTRGIVSAVNRPNPFRDDARQPGDYIQTDAAINPGNSGGALVNAHGRAGGDQRRASSRIQRIVCGCGVCDSGSRRRRASTEQLIDARARCDHGYLGISMNDVTPENAHFFNLTTADGAIVTQVSPDSPASRAGLRNGDVIERLNGKPMLSSGTLQVAVAAVPPGTKVQLGILRDGKSQALDLTVGEFKQNGEVAKNDGGSDGAGGHEGKLGLAMADLTPDVRQQLNLPDTMQGAAVESVRAGSPAEDAGLQRGDIIVQVNRHAVESAQAAVTSVRALPANQDVLLLVWSHGGESYRVVHLG